MYKTILVLKASNSMLLKMNLVLIVLRTHLKNGFESINAISILFKTERYGAIFAEKYCTFANT